MKKDRQAKIIEIISERSIETQEDLCNALKEAGFEATQATVSRDIRRLNLVKVALPNGKQKYALPHMHVNDTYAEKYVRILKDAFVAMDSAQNILVIRTVSGMAMAAAAALDNMHMPGLVGCIAGDDTIMAAVKTNEETAALMEQIKAIVY